MWPCCRVTRCWPRRAPFWCSPPSRRTRWDDPALGLLMTISPSLDVLRAPVLLSVMCAESSRSLSLCV
jgi:hypothetical protein